MSFDMDGEDRRGELRGELLAGLELAYSPLLVCSSKCPRRTGRNLPLVLSIFIRDLVATTRESGVGESRWQDPSIDPCDPRGDEAHLSSNISDGMARVLLPESAES